MGEASIPFRCLSNAIICDLKKRVSSIRRSSLLSITLGLLLTVIGASFVRFLEKAAGQSTAHLSFAFAHVRMARAGPYYCVGGGLGPARFGSYRTPWGRGGASVSTVRVTYALPASEALTSVKDYSSSSPLFFGHHVIDVQSPKRRPSTTALSKKLHSLPSSIRRIIQKLEVSPDADPRPSRRLGRG